MSDTKAQFNPGDAPDGYFAVKVDAGNACTGCALLEKGTPSCHPCLPWFRDDLAYTVFRPSGKVEATHSVEAKLRLVGDLWFLKSFHDPVTYSLRVNADTPAAKLGEYVAQAGLGWRAYAAVLAIITSPNEERDEAAKAFSDVVRFTVEP